MPITISDVKTFMVQTDGAGRRFIIVKVQTSEPGLYGLGCATFTQRHRATYAAIESHLKPFVLGKDVLRSEELFHMNQVQSYWRNGPVLNNAISGIDQALWDIKGKLANMPVYDLLGGKCREAAAVYAHADGRDPQEVLENVRKYQEEGYRYIRVQMGGYGGKGAEFHKPDGALDGSYYDPRAYTRSMLKMIEYVRSHVGGEVELLHDIHERLSPVDTVQFAKDVEPFKLFFLEDSLAPEDIEWFRMIRAAVRHPDRDGRAAQQPARMAPDDRRAPGRLYSHARQPDGRDHPGAQRRDPCRVLRHSHRVARPRRYLAGRARCQPGPGLMGAEFRHPGMVPLRQPGVRHVPRAARGARRLHVPQRQTRPGDRFRRGAGGKIPAGRRGRFLDADPPARRHPGKTLGLTGGG